MLNIGDIIEFTSDYSHIKYEGIIRNIFENLYSVITKKLNQFAVNINDKSIEYISHSNIHNYLKFESN